MKKLIVSLGILAALSLTACGTQPTSGGSAATQAAIQPVEKTTPTPTPTEAKSVRGNTVKKIGEPAFWRKDGETDAEKVGQFAITKIADVKCDQPYAQKPVNGKMIALTIDLETLPTLADETVPNVYLSSYSFKYVADNGTTFNGELGSTATYSCIDPALALKGDYGPGEKAHGVIVLDVPKSGGILTAGKVEWKLP